MSRPNPTTNFQRSFSVHDSYSAARLREVVARFFQPGQQRYSSIFRVDPVLKEVPFVGLGEIQFFISEAELREVYAEPTGRLLRESYDRTQRTSLGREQLLIELIPETRSGLLKICELAGGNRLYREFTNFRANDYGYVLEGF